MPKRNRLSLRELDRAIWRTANAAIERASPLVPASGSPAPDKSLDHLAWSRRYLGIISKKPASELHKWLAVECDAARKSEA